MPPDAYLGIDLGGTKILAVVGDAQGAALASATVSTPAGESPQAAVDAIDSASRAALADARSSLADVARVGIAAAGAIDSANGLVVHAPQLPAWRNVPLVAMVRERLGLPAVIGNDADLAALAEQRFGAGKGVANLLYVTVSTGIGGGLIIDNRLYRGQHGFAGEIGHVSVQAGGRYGRSMVAGAVESLASGAAIAQIAQERINAGEASAIERGPDGVTAPAVFAAYRAGDPLAVSVVRDAIGYLGAALTTWVNILDPGIIVIGGGLSNEWDVYIEPAVRVMRQQAFAEQSRAVPVVPPSLGAPARPRCAIAHPPPHTAKTKPPPPPAQPTPPPTLGAEAGALGAIALAAADSA
ncbi:MAG: ROK family protein [Chloroflexota bacterium]|nr:ROK family protein [Chloroflexota bacterium]